MGGGVRADGGQVWSFVIQPGKCGGRVGHRWSGRVVCGDAGPLTPSGRAQSVPGTRRSGQVVVEEAGQRRPPVSFLGFGGGGVARRGAQQGGGALTGGGAGGREGWSPQD